MRKILHPHAQGCALCFSKPCSDAGSFFSCELVSHEGVFAEVLASNWGVVDAVIVEATYGVSKHLPREDREQRFLKKVRQALSRGGRVLLPVVALGRAQVRGHCLVLLEGSIGQKPQGGSCICRNA